MSILGLVSIVVGFLIGLFSISSNSKYGFEDEDAGQEEQEFTPLFTVSLPEDAKVIIKRYLMYSQEWDMQLIVDLPEAPEGYKWESVELLPLNCAHINREDMPLDSQLEKRITFELKRLPRF